MSKHYVARNVPGLPGEPQILCVDKARIYWRDIAISRALDHPTAMCFSSQKAAWRAADMHGGIAICDVEHAARASLKASYEHPNLLIGGYKWKPSDSTCAPR